ncbi:3'-5' exonuclease [Sphingobium sp. H39-3-25]|nr:3'-5' exonuclease [Sphingobium arseniciresistens]
MSIVQHLLNRLAGRAGADPAARAPALHMESDELARRLEAMPGYRVLRALNVDIGDAELPIPAPGQRIAAVVDTETTGLDPDVDRTVEVAIQRFTFDRAGQIVAIERVRSWLEDPGRAMPERLTALTGLTDADLAGQRFDDAAIVKLIGEADFVIAHNAAFDRPFLDLRFPPLRRLPWACSLSQLDWLALGFDGRSLGHLLLQGGWFFQGHRAGNDVAALTALLGLKVASDRTILSHLLERAEAASIRIEAVGAPFDAKDLLKGAGYRWDARRRFWWREAEEVGLPSEVDWLEQNVYRGRGRANLRPITARERFARDT